MEQSEASRLINDAVTRLATTETALYDPNGIYILIPYVSQNGQFCATPVYSSPNVDVDGSIALSATAASTVMAYVNGIVSAIEKPLYYHVVLAVSDGSLLDQIFHKESTLGFPFIHKALYYKSFLVDEKYEDLLSCSAQAAAGNSTYFDSDLFLSCMAQKEAANYEKLSIETGNIDFLTSGAVSIESKLNALQDISKWRSMPSVFPNIRPYYIGDEAVFLAFNKYHINRLTNGEWLAGIQHLAGDESAYMPLVHAYQDISALGSVIDPLIYTVLDIASLIPLAGSLADGIGVIYSGVLRKDYTKTGFYAAGFALGGGIAIASRTAKRYVAVTAFEPTGIGVSVRELQLGQELGQQWRYSTLANSLGEAELIISRNVADPSVQLARMPYDDLYESVLFAARRSASDLAVNQQLGDIAMDIAAMAPRLMEQGLSAQLLDILLAVPSASSRRELIASLEHLARTERLSVLKSDLVGSNGADLIAAFAGDVGRLRGGGRCCPILRY